MSVTNISTVISVLPNIMKFISANQKDIDVCNQSLVGLQKAYIPDEYIEFLEKISDGLSIDGICLFGTIEQKYKSYVLPSLVNINSIFEDITFLLDYLIIGQFFSLYITYNYTSKQYELINLITNNPVYTYLSFERLFYELLIKRNEE